MALIAQETLADPLHADTPWHGDVLSALALRLRPPSDFPCTFSQNAFRRELLLFSFVETLTDCGLAGLRSDLMDYVRISREWDGHINNARPLIIAFSPSITGSMPLGEYHALGWRVLQDWHDNDPEAWPDDVSPDPESPFWSMCFGGMQLFVNMSAPAHINRKSRNLGGCFLFVVNPRERFDVVAGETPEGRRVREIIRSRVSAYDGLPHAPVLGKFLKGDLEWPQYALPDDNASAPSRCPFRQRTSSR